MQTLRNRYTIQPQIWAARPSIQLSASPTFTQSQFFAIPTTAIITERGYKTSNSTLQKKRNKDIRTGDVMPSSSRRNQVPGFFNDPWALPSWSNDMFRGWPLSRQSPFDLIEKEFEDFPIDMSLSSELANWSPSIDISETDKSINVSADLPGIKKEDIKIKIENDVLTISGERKSEKTEENDDKKWKRMERTYGKFMRRMQLPEGISSSDIKAKYEDGVLKLDIPKPKSVEKPSGEIKIE